MEDQEHSKHDAARNSNQPFPAIKLPKSYQAPSLLVFGKIQSIVAAGSGTMAEGMFSMSMTRRA